jgi:hypothetical protein
MQITRTHLRVAVLLLLAAISFAGCGNRAAREEESTKKPAGRPTIVCIPISARRTMPSPSAAL